MLKDGRFVLVMQEFDVKVFEPWEDAEPRATLGPEDGLISIVPLPGRRALTLCVAHNAYTPLVCWNLETGKGKVHKSPGFPAAAAPIDDVTYVVGWMSGDLTLREREK